jgi:hypothetical protein
MTAKEAAKRGLKPLARIVSWGPGRRRSEDHGHRPDPGVAQGAGEGRLEGQRSRPVEANEAFAAQACAVNKDLGWDPSIVNVNGGAIAIGHPIGASGRPRAGHAAARDGKARRQEGPRHAVHRRRHGRRDVPSSAERSRVICGIIKDVDASYEPTLDCLNNKRRNAAGIIKGELTWQGCIGYGRYARHRRGDLEGLKKAGYRLRRAMPAMTRLPQIQRRDRHPGLSNGTFRL